MKTEAFWEKKFSVGLAMKMGEAELAGILDRYERFIDNIYVSPPMGARFHGRTQVAEQFRDQKTVEKFWRMAEMIREHDITLEVVFNTHELKPEDIPACRKLFDRHGIKVGKVATLDCIDWYVPQCRMYFPEAAIVHSVNDMPETPEGYRHLKHRYDEMVIGRQLIRSGGALKAIGEEGAKRILLLNNGCSFFCGGCRDADYCREVYEKTRKTYGAEYLYALQSILPYEIHEDFLPAESVDFFKLSTRNGDADYIRKCLDSYIYNKGEAYIAEGTKNYLLWGRLAWHIPYYGRFDYARIRAIKETLYGG